MFEDIVKPIDPVWERRKKRLLIALAVVVVVAPILYYEFRNWSEERAVKRFLTALQQEDYQRAYELWKPAPSYRYQDFLRDWGKESEFGKVASFEITRTRDRGSGVVITARINQRETRIWVEKRDKSLSFPP